MAGSSAHPLAVAVLGLGSIGRRHAALAVEHGAAIRAYDPVHREAPSGARVVESSEEALDGAAAAIIASPTSVHVEQAHMALDHGCHLLVEKPLATSTAEAATLVTRAASEGRMLAVAMNLRFHPGPTQVHQLVASGAIGRPLFGHFTFGSYLPSWRPRENYRETYSARSDLGGGVLLDVVHEIDYALWILGGVRALSAVVAKVSDLELDVEDMASLQMEFESGAVASMDLDYLDRSYRRGCRIVGSEGSVAWSWHLEHVVLYGPDGTEELRPTPSDVTPTYAAQMGEFLSAVRAGGDLTDTRLVSGAEGYRALEVVDASRESASSGRRIELTPS